MGKQFDTGQDALYTKCGEAYYRGILFEKIKTQVDNWGTMIQLLDGKKLGVNPLKYNTSVNKKIYIKSSNLFNTPNNTKNKSYCISNSTNFKGNFTTTKDTGIEKSMLDRNTILQMLEQVKIQEDNFEIETYY